MNQPLLDPMCGSGTFIIEAMQKFAKLPANFLPNKVRNFACENFSSHSPFENVDWKLLRSEALENWSNLNQVIKNMPIVIGRDSSSEMINIAKKNAFHALPEVISNSINWEVTDFSNFDSLNHKNCTSGILVTNPPFGMRIEFDESSKNEFIKQIGSILKKKLRWMDCLDFDR
jgi:putative N6-adenine-specific DNA methylase